jgi:hypothetical protein
VAVSVGGGAAALASHGEQHLKPAFLVVTYTGCPMVTFIRGHFCNRSRRKRGPSGGTGNAFAYFPPRLMPFS